MGAENSLKMSMARRALCLLALLAIGALQHAALAQDQTALVSPRSKLASRMRGVIARVCTDHRPVFASKSYHAHAPVRSPQQVVPGVSTVVPNIVGHGGVAEALRTPIRCGLQPWRALTQLRSAPLCRPDKNSR